MAAIELITKTDLKSFLDISSGVTTWDAVLTVIAKSISQFVRMYTGRDFNTAVQTSATEYHDGSENGLQRFFLVAKNFPITSIASISYGQGEYDALTWTTLDPSFEYIANLQDGLIQFPGGLPLGYQNIRLIYTHETATFSEDYPVLFHACLKLGASHFERRKAEGLLQESIGGASVQWMGYLDPETRQMLDLHKTINV